jgi:hypothetical protein
MHATPLIALSKNLSYRCNPIKNNIYIVDKVIYSVKTFIALEIIILEERWHINVKMTKQYLQRWGLRSSWLQNNQAKI